MGNTAKLRVRVGREGGGAGGRGHAVCFGVFLRSEIIHSGMGGGRDVPGLSRNTGCCGDGGGEGGCILIYSTEGCRRY